MNRIVRSLAITATALAAAVVTLPADARPGGGGAVGFHGGFHGGYGGYHGGYRGGYWGGHRGYWGGGPGVFWGGIGLGLGLGALAYSTYPYYAAPAGYYGDYYDPGVVVGQPVPPVTEYPSQPVAATSQPVPQASRAADPIFYPKNGQTAARTESDRQECNRWATTQPNSMNDASIFQRATFACMEGRGYTVR